MSRHRLRTAETYAFVIPFCLAILFPFAVMLSSALKKDAEIFVTAEEFRFVSASPQWGNFLELPKQLPLFGRYFLNSAAIATGATLLAVIVALPAAYALSRLRFAGRRAFLYAVLVTQMFSPIVIIIGLFKLFAGLPIPLTNSLWGLILANAAFNLAFAIWMLSGYFNTVPAEIEEAAMVDGCTWVQMIVRILIPLAAPGIVTATIFVFIASWNEFIFALTLLASPEKRPVIVGLFSLIGMYEVKWNFVMGGALLAVLPMIVLFWVAEKHIVSGLTAGGVK
ncbi:MAG: carbohydrate ABC transporter permease [Candidatus Sumerlaeaceae bacterium]|nr:carbohydrate ABC transporter permease [Candidatus Sumerlaeaceae bacterium]